MFLFSALRHLLRSLFVPRLVLVTENLALRQQLLVLRRSTKGPRLRHGDRLFWVTLSHLWRAWRSILVIVKPTWNDQSTHYRLRFDPLNPRLSGELEDD